MLAVIGLLGLLFPLGNIWQETASPNLSRGKHKKRAGESIISKPLNYQCVPFALSLYLILLSTTSVDSAKKAITACHILAWQWGWGLEQPIMAPLFSKICWVKGEGFNSHTDIKSTPPHHTLWEQ